MSGGGGVAVSIRGPVVLYFSRNLDTPCSSFPCRHLDNLVQQKMAGVGQWLDQAPQKPHQVPLRRAKPKA